MPEAEIEENAMPMIPELGLLLKSSETVETAPKYWVETEVEPRETVSVARVPWTVPDP